MFVVSNPLDPCWLQEIILGRFGNSSWLPDIPLGIQTYHHAINTEVNHVPEVILPPCCNVSTQLAGASVTSTPLRHHSFWVLEVLFGLFIGNLHG